MTTTSTARTKCHCWVTVDIQVKPAWGRLGAEARHFRCLRRRPAFLCMAARTGCWTILARTVCVPALNLFSWRCLTVKLARFALSPVAGCPGRLRLAGSATPPRWSKADQRGTPVQKRLNPSPPNRPVASGPERRATGRRSPTPRHLYFDFDSDAVSPSSRTRRQHANRLTRTRRSTCCSKGHTDERGGREYNLALGQRRAESVASP